MGRVLFLVCGLVLAASALAGCSIDAGVTWAPDVLKARAPPPAEPSAPPDVRLLLQTRLSEFFVPSTAPSNISFSAPRLVEADWQSCIRANVKGAMGGRVGAQTFAVTFLRNSVFREERAGPEHWCAGEHYEAL